MPQIGVQGGPGGARQGADVSFIIDREATGSCTPESSVEIEIASRDTDGDDLPHGPLAVLLFEQE
jgi:hypothetical protein